MCLKDKALFVFASASSLNETFVDERHLARATMEAQLDSCGLRHLARTTNREALLDSCGLRHLARTTKREAQLDSFELRHLAHAIKREALLDSGWFGERLFGSSASKSIRLIGSRVGSQLGSFVSRSLVLQIETNAFPELDFQQQGSCL